MLALSSCQVDNRRGSVDFDVIKGKCVTSLEVCFRLILSRDDAILHEDIFQGEFFRIGDIESIDTFDADIFQRDIFSIRGE